MGTEAHRFHLCPARQHIRWGMPDRTWQHVAEVACAEGGPSQLLWTRGLVANPAAAWKFHPIQDEHHTWSALAEPIAYSGDVFGDGSKKGIREWAPCGWAAVSMNGSEVQQAKWGPLPVELPVQRRIKRAELWAFWQ
eukprot:7221829-Karenia_brevis.AAC.1